MVLRDNTVESGSEGDKSMVETEEESDEVEYAAEGEVLVTRCVLNFQVKEDDIEQQRENIFHTCCLINNKVCSMIIDGGSYINVASTTLVEKLNLQTLKHPKPYKLQWLNECGEIWAKKQVIISFSIGKYSDEVLCHVFLCILDIYSLGDHGSLIGG